MPVCFLCRQNFAINNLKQHFDSVHYDNDDLKKYTCGENNCNRSYNNYFSFQRHWTTNHNTILQCQESEAKADSLAMDKSKLCQASSACKQEKFNKTISSSSSNKTQIKNNKIQVFKNLQEDIFNSGLKMYKTPAVSRKQVQQFFTSSKAIVNTGLNTIKKELLNVNADSSGMINLKVVTDLLDSFSSAFDDLDTEHKRIKILKDKNLYIESEKFLLGERSQGYKRNLDGTVKKESSQAYAYQFPLKTMLKKIFELPEVYDGVLRYVQQLEGETSVISNFIQSNLWKRKIQNFGSKRVFPIMLFCDDYETGNALGSHSGCNKLCGCYITLPCFPPQYQSSLETIFHALLFYSQEREQFGNATVFRLLIDQLNDLETEGLELDLSHGKVQVYFKLGLIVGDNLGLHSILGFVESFNANYACRFCKMDKDQRSMASLEDPVYMRTKTTYAKDLLLSDVSATGIKHESTFHCLNDFHVTENFATDIMHDVFEGVCVFDMSALIKHYITVEKYFSLSQLNHRIRIHSWGATESNIPLPISENDFKNQHLRMSAAEMLTFVRHFGLLVGDFVPEDDPAWQIYSILRQIINVITSPSVQVKCYLMLRVLIKEHHTLVRSLLKRILKPKDHIFTHLPTIMAECGPPVHFWCMRFEGKHRESTIPASVSNCKKNIAQTIVTKHQLKFACQLYARNIFPVFEEGPSSSCKLSDLLVTFDYSLNREQNFLNTVIHKVNWVNKNGSK